MRNTHISQLHVSYMFQQVLMVKLFLDNPEHRHNVELFVQSEEKCITLVIHYSRLTAVGNGAGPEGIRGLKSTLLGCPEVGSGGIPGRCCQWNPPGGCMGIPGPGGGRLEACRKEEQTECDDVVTFSAHSEIDNSKKAKEDILDFARVL